MKLSEINEGFRYEADLTADDLENTSVKLLRDKGRFIFLDVDHPQDFIHIQPVMKSAKLPMKPKDPRSLSTFEGARIWYGFKLVDHTNYQTDLFRTAHPATDVTNVIDSIRLRGWPSEGGGKIDTLESLNKLRTEWLVWLPRFRRDEDLGHNIEAYEHNLGNIEALIAQLESMGVDSIGALLRKIGQIDHADKAHIKEHLGYLQYAFAKAVKDPQTPDERKVSDDFIRISVELFADKMPDVGYTIIAYPRSSKPFNQKFAEALSNKIGAYQIQINKRKSGDIKINRDELLRRANMLAQSNKMLQHIDGIPVTDPRWPELWADREEQKLRALLPTSQKSTTAIKSISYGDKRRYLQLFDIEEPEWFTGEPVLIVDDNVAHQGTMELLYDIVKTANPARIDMYTPFLLRT